MLFISIGTYTMILSLISYNHLCRNLCTFNIIHILYFLYFNKKKTFIYYIIYIMHILLFCLCNQLFVRVIKKEHWYTKINIIYYFIIYAIIIFSMTFQLGRYLYLI